MNDITRRRTLGLVAASVPVAAFTATASAQSSDSGTITADPSTAGATATHTVTATVGDAAGSSWNSLVVDYAGSDADASNVGTGDLQTIGIDRGDDGDGTTIDVDASDDVSSVSASNNGETLTIGLGGNYTLEDGDQVVAVYGDVQNPPDSGTDTVSLVVNQQSAAAESTAELTIDDEGGESGGGTDESTDEQDGTDSTDEQDETGDQDGGDTDCATVTFCPHETDGDTVTVASATLPDGGYVVVHDATLLDGAVVESIRGSSDYLEAGTHEDVCVSLDDCLDEDATLIAMPHRETDDDESYDFPSDTETDGPYTCEGDAVTDDAAVTVVCDE